MSKIILKVQPTDKMQEVHVLTATKNGVSTDKVYGVELNQLPKFIVNQNGVEEVHFKGNSSFAQKIIDEAKMEEFTKYSENKILYYINDASVRNTIQ